jgi:hypothetical protein
MDVGSWLAFTHGWICKPIAALCVVTLISRREVRGMAPVAMASVLEALEARNGCLKCFACFAQSGQGGLQIHVANLLNN